MSLGLHLRLPQPIIANGGVCRDLAIAENPLPEPWKGESSSACGMCIGCVCAGRRVLLHLAST